MKHFVRLTPEEIQKLKIGDKVWFCGDLVISDDFDEEDMEYGTIVDIEKTRATTNRPVTANDIFSEPVGNIQSFIIKETDDDSGLELGVSPLNIFKPKQEASMAKSKRCNNEIKRTNKRKTVQNQSKKESSSTPAGENRQFLPVLLENGEKTELPIEAVISSAVFDPNKTHPTAERNLALTIEHGKETSCYYVRPSDVEKYILDYNKAPVDFERVNKKAIETLHDLKKAWVKFGAAILDVNALRAYRLKYTRFEEFCEKELKLHPSTVYEVMTSTLFLMREQPDIYHALIQGDAKAELTLPSYRSLYLVAKKKKQLERKEKYQEIVESMLHGQLSTRELQKRIKEVLQGDEQKDSAWQLLVKNFEKMYEEMEGFDIPKQIKAEAQSFLEKLKKLDI